MLFYLIQRLSALIIVICLWMVKTTGYTKRYPYRWKPCSENPRWPKAIRVIRVHPWQQTKNPCTCKEQPHPWL